MMDLKKKPLPGPKRRKKNTHRPKNEPSAQRVWAQCQMSSPTAKTTTSSLGASPSLPGVPGVETEPIPSTSTEDSTISTLPGIPPNKTSQTSVTQSLTGLPDTVTLPDLVLDHSTAENTNIVEQDLEAASALLNLGDTRDSTLDDDTDNTDLMPIGGIGSVPLDVAPQPLRLDQVSVDAAIAGIVQTEENNENPADDTTKPPAGTTPIVDNLDVPVETAKQEDDIPLATLAKTLEKPKLPVKGVLKTKTYSLKKKPDSKRTFRCIACDVVKSSVHNLNMHYRRRHPPQMCGICGRTFTLPSRLARHMYDHNERCYHCNKCDESFHFESELVSHKIVHRSKSKPTFQCMKNKCGKWFMRKWDLTLHLQKHRGKKHNCDYNNCTFSTDTEKQLKEHYKSHSDDCTVKCKLCDKSFRYRSGLKRHHDNDHKDQ